MWQVPSKMCTLASPPPPPLSPPATLLYLFHAKCRAKCSVLRVHRDGTVHVTALGHRVELGVILSRGLRREPA